MQPPRSEPDAGARRAPSWRRWGWPAGAAAAGAWLAWTLLEPQAAASPPEPARAAAAAVPPAAAAPASAPAPAVAPSSGAAGEQARLARRALWQQRLERAEQALDAYRESTRYPPSSQPMRAHPDQVRPNEPVAEEHAIGAADGRDAAFLRTTQERVFVQGAESVLFTLSLRDAGGQPLPLRVVRASAREVPPPGSGSMHPVVPLNFNDAAADGDAVAGDDVHSVRLQPAAQGYAGLAGQIRVEAVLQYRDRQGATHFDVYYTPQAPATWQGGVREAVEDGSLSLYLGAAVREAGRYVVTARVDDARGTPLALLTFNDEVGQGAQEFRLSLHGRLLRDAKPAFPLTLRDVDAFLLRPDAFPDRSLMPRLAGPVHATRDHMLASFSADEWQGEQRGRYLEELGRDVARARAELERLSAPP